MLCVLISPKWDMDKCVVGTHLTKMGHGQTYVVGTDLTKMGHGKTYVVGTHLTKMGNG